MAEEIMEKLLQLANQPEFYWQIVIASVCIAASLFISNQTKRYLLGKIEQFTVKKKLNVRQLITKYFNPLFAPSLAVILLAVNAVMLVEVSGSADIIFACTQFAFIWLILRFVSVFSESNGITVLVGVVLGLIVVLNIFEVLTPTIDYLDKYAISAGKVRVSVYTILKALVVFSIVLWFAGVISRGGNNYIRSMKKIKSSNRELLSKLFNIVLYFTVFLIGLNVIGVDLTAFAVIGGAVGVGIGFGLQKITSNFISGIILLVERSIRVEDMIELQGGVTGVIRHLGARYTLVETFEGKEIMVPNEDFITNQVINWTYSNTKARVEIPVSVSYSSDIEKARELILEAAKSHPRCISEPPPACYVMSFADNSIKFTLYFWIADIMQGRREPQNDVMVAIWKKFREHNIEFPNSPHELLIRNPAAVQV